MRTQLGTVLLLLILLVLSACSSDPDQTPAPAEAPDPGEKGTAIVEELVVQELAGPEPGFQALVRGHLSNTCTSLNAATAESGEAGFTIDLITAQLENVPCFDQSIPFERVIPLETGEMEPGEILVQAGEYKVNIEFEGSVVEGPGEQDPAPTPAESPIATVSIGGYVWHDSCVNQGEAGETARSGCINLAGQFVADGIKSAGETGIAGVEVLLGDQACPAVGLAQATTSEDGQFAFDKLESGTYCISVESTSSLNMATLGEGIWTSPADGSGSLTVELTDGQPSEEVALGWDFTNLPELPAEAAAPPESDCFAKAAYYGDINIPDNTVLEPGERFTKKWRIRNEGTCTWGSGYDLIFANGDLLGGAPSTPLPPAAPGEIVEVSVDLMAPVESGYYRGNWGFRTPEGKTFAVGAGGNTPIWVQIVVSFYSGSSPAPVPISSATCGEDQNSDYVAELLAGVNAQRAQRGLPALVQQDQLTAAAQVHSSDMACNDLPRSGANPHIGSDGGGYADRARAQGYTDFSYITENVYTGNPQFGGTPARAIEYWMDSKDHRDAILHPKVTEIGIGYAFSTTSKYGAYYTLLFAQPTD